MGKYDLAIAALERARELGGDVPSILGALGEVLARAGRVEEARAFLTRTQGIVADALGSGELLRGSAFRFGRPSHCIDLSGNRDRSP